MICPKCGKELSDTAKFCPVCGSGVDAGQFAETASEPVSEPTGNVITDTYPSQEPVSAPDFPEPTNVLQPETVRPEKGKFSKKMIIGAGAAVAGLAVAGVTAAGLTFAKADFAHTFMGDEKYATALMGQQLEQVVNTPMLSGVMAGAGVAGVADSDDISAALTSSMASFKSMIPEAGAEIEMSVSADLSADHLQGIADNLGCDTDKVKEIVEAVQALKAKAGVQFTETGIAAQAAGSEGGSDIIKVNALYDAETEAYYISAPAVSDECLMIANDDIVIDMDSLNTEGTDDKAAKELLDSILKAYKDSLEDAEIVYEKTEFSIGDIEFKGKMSSVTLEDEALADMLSNVSDEFFDSDFADSLGDAGSMQSSIDKAISELEDIDGLKVTIDNYVNSNNTVAGMRVEFEAKSNGGKVKGEVAYLNTKDGMACSVEADGKSIFELSQEKESKTTGKFTAKISDGNDSGKINIEYENYKEKEMFGQKVALGDYSFKFTGEMFSDEDYPIERLTLKLSDEDDKLNYDIGVKIDGSTFSAKMALSEGIGEAITADSMKISGAYDLTSEDEEDKTKVNGYYAKLIEYLANQTKESKFCNAVPVNDGTLAEYLQMTAQRARRESELPQNYAEYNANSVSYANEAAGTIASRSSYINFKTASSLTKVKLYYDKDGKFSILDNGGLSSLENSIIENLGNLGYKSAYVEIVVWPGRGPVCGVNVVLTDNSSNIPANLPNEYNFLDRKFKWGTSEDVNYVGSFVVGTSRRLSNSEGGDTKAADEKLAAEVKSFNADAEKAFKAMSSYNGLIAESNYGYMVFSVSNGRWSYYTYNGSFSGSVEDAASYLTQKVGTIGAQRVCFYYEGTSLKGAIASNTYYESSFAVDDFKSGSTEKWSYMDGVIDGNAIGTSPALTKMTTLDKDYVDLMTGTWVSGSTSLTLSEDDFKSATFSIDRSYGTIYYIYVTTVNQGSFYYYPNNGEPYIRMRNYSYRFTKL